MISNTTFQNYPTDPTLYLNALKQQAANGGGDQQTLIQDLIQELSQMLQQMQNAGSGAAPSMPAMPSAMTPNGAAPTTGGAMPAQTGGAMPSTMGGAQPATGGMTAQNASGVLASYMDQNNIGATDPDAMYQLATNANGSTPPMVQQAAQYMMANPSVYQQIETHDVAGTDGKSAASNFRWAAQGGLGQAGNVPAGGTGAAAPAYAMPPQTGGVPMASGGMGYPVSPQAGGVPMASGGMGYPVQPQMGGMMAQPPAYSMPPQAGTSGDLTADGKPLQQAGESQALSAFSQQDPAGFQAFESALSHGDGNTATHVLANSISSGKISTGTGSALGSQLQQTANQHGGGKINSDARNALKNALGGDDVLTPGKTRGTIAFEHLTGINTSSILGVSTQ
ncbi:hypothetical protein G3N58_03785 [Paraburkholderia sp. Ac-20342]|uniref:hypothetical protein n=1 Tax=unclassified Paraburkholderia TaxID=2615204 RepID=UPI00142181B8|nr:MULTISPECIES: hypothetical protein [unclassified Paraburkholderia]MBN3845953.1 hypothetical protein [Paraburkholderia sp. Ac-20342]NIF77794.1 hypothetical protein [Paraburkholderia sp. Cy-641]